MCFYVNCIVTILLDVLNCLQEFAFQKLIFVTMLAWEDPCNEDDAPLSSLDNYSVLVMTYPSMFSLYWSCKKKKDSELDILKC